MYTDFATVYDALMADVDYLSWARFYQELMARYGLQGGHICECACGTGNLTQYFYDFGYGVIASDISREMLQIASKKARDHAREGIHFICQDMRKINLHHMQDAVLCTNDGVNYLQSEKDLMQFFQSAWQVLRPGGCLFFDLSTPYKLREVLGNHFIGDETQDISYLWQNRYNNMQDYVEMRLAVFVRQHDETYQRIYEEQRQYAHSQQRIERLLNACGYRDIQIYGDKHFKRPSPQESRWFFSACKPEDLSMQEG